MFYTRHQPRGAAHDKSSLASAGKHSKDIAVVPNLYHADNFLTLDREALDKTSGK